MTLQPRAVVIHRRSEYDELIARHGTRQQAAFFLRARDRSLDDVVARHEAQQSATQQTTTVIPADWRRAAVERADLDRFVFGPEDVVVVVGQDGLVANVAKYLDGQPVVGINPEPERNPGILVPHAPASAGVLLRTAIREPTVQERTMVFAITDDGETISALNEIYVGHVSHQSARYQLCCGDRPPERQSSSGILAGTGTGATGWLRSVWEERHSTLELPQPTERRLCWFVREAWPSLMTGTTLTEGTLGAGETLTLIAESDQLVCFGDGIEADSVALTWGQRLTISQSDQCLRLVVG